MLSWWYKLLDKEKTDQDPFSFRKQHSRRRQFHGMWGPGASWGTTWGAQFVKTKIFMLNHLILTESARFAGCPKSEAQKETLWWSGPLIWSTVAAAGSGGEERWGNNFKKCFGWLNCIGFFREETETTLKLKRNAMRSVSIQKANGYLQTSNFFCKSKTFLPHYFWLGLQLTHGAGSLRRFLLPLWLQSRTRDLWTIQIWRLPWWDGPQEVANVLLSCSTGNNNKFKTIEECDEMCVENDFKLMLTDKCEQPIEPGPWWDISQSLFFFNAHQSSFFVIALF